MSGRAIRVSIPYAVKPFVPPTRCWRSQSPTTETATIAPRTDRKYRRSASGVSRLTARMVTMPATAAPLAAIPRSELGCADRHNRRTEEPEGADRRS